MRSVMIALMSCGLASVATMAEARELKTNDRYMCSWGAGTAAKAQELKLAGVAVRRAAEAADLQIHQTVDAHDGHGHHRTDLRQPLANQAGGHSPRLL